MRYFHQQDYSVIIQQQYMNQQLVQNNISTILKAENMALEDAYSLLVQRYDINAEFTNTGSYSLAATYSASDRVILDYANYSITSTYSIGDCVIYNTGAYCLTGTNSLGPSASPSLTYWSNLGNQYDIFYVKYPKPLFNYQNDYLVNDQVYWDSQTWNCMTDTANYSISEAQQFLTINNIPIKNIFPNDRVNNKNYAYWQPLGTYSVPAGTLPTNTTYWTKGDNRSKLLMLHLMDIVIYYLFKNISPMNIEEHRIKAYKDGLQYLKDIADGKKNSPILKDQPSGAGMFIMYGGNTKSPRARY